MTERTNRPAWRAALASVSAITVAVGLVVSGTASQIAGVQALAVGQARKSSNKQQLVNVFLPPPREFRQGLSRARKALREKRYSDAVAELSAVLHDPDTEDYFIGTADEPLTSSSLKTEARRLLGSMSDEGRQWYELQFGDQAGEMLDRAIEESDVVKLAEVIRQFSHTEAGYEAELLLGRHHLDRGDPIAAARCFQRVAEASSVSGRYEPELSVILATCWLYGQMPDKAHKTLLALKTRFPAAAVRIRDSQIKLFDDQAQALDWLRELIGPGHRSTLAQQTHWPLFRGNPSRNAQSAGGGPLMHARWRVPTSNDPAEEEQIERLRKQYLDEQRPAVPSLQLLAVGGVLLMRTPRDLMAVDPGSGKRIWEVKPQIDDRFDAAPAAGRNLRARDVRRVTKRRWDQRMWADAAYGQLSSDGEHVIFIEDLGFPGDAAPQVRMFPPPAGRMRNPGAPKDYNRLVACELRTEGKRKWEVGGQTGGHEPALAGAFFLGAPLALEGRLYVLVEMKGEIRLVVLAAKTGRMEWSQQLAHVDTATILKDPARRLAGATPSYADGVLVCPTSTGAVVAVDVATRSLLWGYRYKQSRQIQRGRRWRGPVRLTQPRPPGGQWADASATIAEGHVLICPIEADKLFCFDLLSGKLLWPPRERKNDLYVACVHQGKAILVGKSQVTALNLSDGKAAWVRDPLTAPPRSAVTMLGWAVGDGGAIQHKAPGAARWRRQPSTTANQLWDVQFVDSKQGWAVGAEGTILHTTNGGAAWSPQASHRTTDFHDAIFLDGRTGWLVGGGGTIVHTTNGGGAWTVQPVPESNRGYDLHGVDFVNANTGWVVGGGGTILHTIDGGANWKQQTSGTKEVLWGVKFVGQLQGWAVGQSGTILHTTDAGNTWNTQDSGTTLNLWGQPSFVDADTGWVFGKSGTILHTTDGGATWTTQPSGSPNGLWGGASVDAQTAWAVGHGGTIRSTTDGGATWTAQVSQTSQTLRHVTIVKQINTDKFVSLPPGTMPSGRGYYSEGHYFLPTTGAEILKIDLDAGQITGRFASPNVGVLGNLICYKDQVFSQGVDFLLKFDQLEPLRLRVAEAMKKNPDDPLALARNGELLVNDGKRHEGLMALRRAYRLDADEARRDETRMLLVDTLLGALRQDFGDSQRLAGEIEQLIDQPDQRIEYLRLMAKGLQRSQQFQAAFDAYMELAGLDRKPAEMEQIEPDWSVRRDRWIQGQLATLYEQADSQDRAKMDTAIEARRQAAIESDTTKAWRRFANYFATHPSADQARMRLAARLIEADNLLAAELLLVPLAASPDGRTAAEATARLAGLFQQSEQFGEAAAYYRLLDERFADTVALDDKTGRDLTAAARKIGPIARGLAARLQWPVGKTSVETSPRRTMPPSSGQTTHPIRIQRGPSPRTDDLNVNIDPQRGIFVRDGLGRERARVAINRSGASRFRSSNFFYGSTRGRALGHLMVFSFGYEVVAVDTLPSEQSQASGLLWRQSLLQSTSGRRAQPPAVKKKRIENPWTGSRDIASDNFRRPIGALGSLGGDGICFQKAGQLICVDPLTGEPIWIRKDVQPGADLFGDDEMLVVSPHDGSPAMVLRVADGQLLGHRDVPKLELRWTTLGRMILTWERKDDGLLLKLLDPWEQRDEWSYQFAAGSKGRLIERDELAVLQPDGKFVLLRLNGGTKRIETTVEPEESLLGIYVLRSADQYILITNARPPASAKRNNIPPVKAGFATPPINGRVYAFARGTGERQWQVPAAIQQYQVPLRQPPDLPVLSLLRYERRKVASSGANQKRRSTTRTHVSLLCIDKRDGRILLAKDGVQANTIAYDIVGDPIKRTVSVTLPGKGSRSFTTYTISFSDEPIPPEPPAQTGTASSLQASTGSSSLRQLAGALFGAASRGAQRAIVPRTTAPTVKFDVDDDD